MRQVIFPSEERMAAELLLSDQNEALPATASGSRPSDSALLDEYSRTVIGAVERVASAVVNIDIKQRGRGAPEIGGGASGFLIAPAAVILTNSPPVPQATPTNGNASRHPALFAPLLGDD